MGSTAYSRSVFLQLVILSSLVWAVAGSFLYEQVLQHFGWDKIGIELRVTLFICFTVVGAVLISVLAYGVYSLFKREATRHSES